MQLPKISFREVFNAVLRWCWIPLSCLVLGAIAAFVYVSLKPVFYTSTGSLYVKTSAPQIFSENPLAQNESDDLEQMKTVEQGLKSSTVLLKVAEKNNLASDPLFQEAGTEPQAILYTMEKRVSVELRKGTRLMDIEVKDTDPARAAKIVEDIFEEYEVWKDGGRKELITKTSSGLASEEQRMRAKMEESEKRLLDFRAEHLVLGLSETQNNQRSTQLEILVQELSAATAERLRLEAQSREMKTQQGEQKSTTLASRGERGTLALSLEGQIATKESEFAMLKERYLYKHPRYIEAAQELKVLQERLVGITVEAEEALSNDLKVALSREKELQGLVAETKTEAMGNEALREQFVRLSRAAEIDRGLYAQVATSLEETKMASVFSASFLRWDDRPIESIWPSGPNKKGFVFIGAFLGAMIGLLLALLLTVFDPRVREPTAVERKLRLPMLARLPVYSREVVQGLDVSGEGLASMIRPAHLARYTPAPQEGSERMQAVLFASPFDGDGKTLCVLKCARTMVKQGYRTLVIDADFCVDGLSRVYSSQREYRHGLAAYLMGEAEAAEVLFETGLPGLWFLPTGAVSGESGDLLSGPKLRELLEAISPMFDRVIFDMSSVLDSEDVQAVARHIGSTYLVAQKGKGKYSQLQKTNEILQSAGGKVTGFIWNDGGRRRSSDESPVIEPVTYPSEVREVSPRGQDEPMPVPPVSTQQAI